MRLHFRCASISAWHAPQLALLTVALRLVHASVAVKRRVLTRRGLQSVAEGWAAGVVMRPEKLGTVTDVLDNASLFTAIAAPSRALRVVLAHREGPRAGEVEADLCIGIGGWGIKSGIPGHATIAKLNRLILIEEQLKTMDEAARAGGQPHLQTAHLRTWRQVYEAEDAAAAEYAEAAENAAQGP